MRFKRTYAIVAITFLLLNFLSCNSWLVSASLTSAIWLADFEQPFSNQLVEAYTFPSGPPKQFVERSTIRAHSGIYSARCVAETDPSVGAKARVMLGDQAFRQLPVVGSLTKGYAGAWFYIQNYDGSAIGLMDWRAHTDERVDAWLMFLTLEGWNELRLRFDWPTFQHTVSKSYDINAELLDGMWHWVEMGFEISSNGWYRVWIDQELMFAWTGNNLSNDGSGPPEFATKPTPPADRVMAGISGLSTVATEVIEVFVDDLAFGSEYLGGSDVSGYWQITISSSGGGSTIPEGSEMVLAGEHLEVKATPSEGYSLTQWVFDGQNVGSTTSIIIPSQPLDSSHTLQAIFEVAESPSPSPNITQTGLEFLDEIVATTSLVAVILWIGRKKRH